MDAAGRRRPRPLLDCATVRFEESLPELALPSRSAWQRTSASERGLYDEDRLDHHARMLTVATSFVEQTAIRARSDM